MSWLEIRESMKAFLGYGTVMLCWVAALFFLRFFRMAGDPLFRIFALAFFILGINGISVAMVHPKQEIEPYFYCVRLLAFILIIYAIIDKNRSGKKSP